MRYRYSDLCVVADDKVHLWTDPVIQLMYLILYPSVFLLGHFCESYATFPIFNVLHFSGNTPALIGPISMKLDTHYCTCH